MTVKQNKSYLRRTVNSDLQSTGPNFTCVNDKRRSLTDGHAVNTVAYNPNTAIPADAVIADLDGERASRNVNAI